MKRGLSNNFINELLSGSLRNLLYYIQHDDTLDLEIRENYINIYYRGGSIIRVTESNPSNFNFFFDLNYLNNNSFIDKDLLVKHLNNREWYSYFPIAKQAMDFYFTSHKSEEKEFQQLVVRDNNYSSIANGTDYFFVDIEYDNHQGARFDLIAFEWLSNSTERKLYKGYKPKLVLIEMKYGDGAISGKSGLKKHLSDFEMLSIDNSALQSLKEEMLDVFKQKRILGLIPCLSYGNNPNEVDTIEECVEFLFLLSNHDPASNILKNELKKCNRNIRLVTSNFMGYGLYKENQIQI